MIKRLFLFLLSFVVTIQGVSALVPSFSDVPQDAWYAGYVEDLEAEGIIDAGEFFRPADSLIRAELVKMIITATGGLDEHIPPPNPTFDDVRPGEWFTNYIEAAATLGIVTGYSDAQGNLIGLFGPADTVNRAAATKMLVEAFDLEMNEDGAKQYPDVSESDWFYEYVLIAGQHGVVSGYDNGRFGPADPVTRAQIAKMVVLGAQTAGIMDTPEPDEVESEVEEEAIKGEDDEPEEEVEEVVLEESVPQATANLAMIEEINTPAGTGEVFVAKYVFRANYEGFNVETVTVVNDIIGDKLGDEPIGTTAIKNVILKFPNKVGGLVTETRSLGSDGKARFTNLTFFVERDEETFFEIYAELNKISEVGAVLSGEVFRLGLQDTNNDNNSFRAVGDISGIVMGYGGSRLPITNSQVKPFTVRKSVPAFTMNEASEVLSNGENTLISYKVTADSAGSVSLARIVFELDVYDAGGVDLSLSDFKLYRDSSYMSNVNIYDATGAQDLTLGSGGSLVNGNSSVIVTFDREENVSPDDSQDYSLRATISASDNNDSINTGIAIGDEDTALSGLSAINQTNTGKLYVNGDATAGIFTGANDFSQVLGTERNIIWSDKSAESHLYPTVSGGVATSDSGSADWTNGFQLDITALTDQLISK